MRTCSKCSPRSRKKYDLKVFPFRHRPTVATQQRMSENFCESVCSMVICAKHKFCLGYDLCAARGNSTRLETNQINNNNNSSSKYNQQQETAIHWCVSSTIVKFINFEAHSPSKRNPTTIHAHPLPLGKKIVEEEDDKRNCTHSYTLCTHIQSHTSPVHISLKNKHKQRPQLLVTRCFLLGSALWNTNNGFTANE